MSAIFYLLIIFSVIIALCFIIVSRMAIKAIRNGESLEIKQKEIYEHQMEHNLASEEHHYEYMNKLDQNKDMISSIDKNVNSMSRDISDRILPRIEDTLKLIDIYGIPATKENIIQYYKSRKIKVSNLTENSLFMGTTQDDIKISIILSIHDDILNICTFSVYTDSIDNITMEELLKYNDSILLGKIGIRDYNGKKVIMIEHATFLTGGRISFGQLNDTITVLCDMQTEINKILRKKVEKIFILLIDDFLKLELGEETYNSIYNKANADEKNNL
jgi:hypothetical protein